VTQLHHLSAAEQVAAIRAGELSAVELCEHYLARAARHGDAVGAFVTLAPELALAQARAAQERRGGHGPLDGVVVPVKDLMPVAGVRCTFGSAAYADFVPEGDGRMAAVLRAAGTVMLGKTTTPEFGMTAHTEGPVAPPARTPYDLSLSAGGSSGGAAAAVAAGLAPVAHGSDGGGSVRGPASVCGLVGLKPGRGTISDGPAESAAALASSGAIARSVRDAALLLDVMAAADPAAGSPGPRELAAAADREPGPLRIGRYRDPVLADVPVAPEVITAYEECSALLASLGHEVVDTAAPITPEEAEAFDPIWSVLGGLAPVPPETEPLLQPITRWHRSQATRYSGLEYASAVARMQGLAYAARERYAAFDAVLAPTLALLPQPVGALRDDEDPAAGFALEKAFSPFSAAWNVLGSAAIQLPLAWTDAGMPVGMTLAAPAGREALLVALAAQLEAARPWAARRAPLFDAA
jgi:amidase